MAEWPTTAKADRGWSSRFTPVVANLWRQLQDELRDYGATIKAKDIESRILMTRAWLSAESCRRRNYIASLIRRDRSDRR